MRRRMNPAEWLLVATLLGWSGCAAPGISPLNYSVREVAQRTRGDAMDAAEVALINLDFVIARRDLTEGIVESQPFEGKLAHEAAEPVDGAGRMRRVAHVRLEDSAAGIRVFCKVAVQVQSTQSYRLLSGERAGDDGPARTPIDRDAATTGEQNALWQTVRRDKATEHVLLTAILRALGSETDSPGEP